MAHLDRAHLDAVDHLGHPAKLACRIDRDGHTVAGRCGDALGSFRGVDRLDVALGANVSVAQLAESAAPVMARPTAAPVSALMIVLCSISRSSLWIVDCCLFLRSAASW